MARFRTDGIDQVIEQMRQLGELTGEVADQMLLAAAEEVKKAWRQAIKQHGLVDTGSLIESIGYARKPKTVGDVRIMDIYPQGKSNSFRDKRNGKTYDRKKPVRFAEIAFINNYGTSSIKATHFVDTADDLASKPVTDIMTRLWEEALRKKGLI